MAGIASRSVELNRLSMCQPGPGVTVEAVEFLKKFLEMYTDRDSFQAALKELARQLFLIQEGQAASVGKR